MGASHLFHWLGGGIPEPWLVCGGNQEASAEMKSFAIKI